jgi:hypothetical protein
MRSFILSLRPRHQMLFVVCLTVLLAFVIATICGHFFDTHQLKENTDLSAAVYQVLGTVYAILLTFTLWGVWQKFNDANASVQNEAYAILDLVHIVETSPNWNDTKIRKASLTYASKVVEHEWPLLSNTDFLNSKEVSHSSSLEIVKEVQSIVPHSDREIAIFSQMLALLNSWLDARRTRILVAQGNSARELWPLLISGAFVLFAFHGLFVAKTYGLWATLLFGFSLIIGITFYLIFSLDCPFQGSLSIDSKPFQLAINILKSPQ